MQPIRLWLANRNGPNPWKVVLVLEELGLPYELKQYPLADVKKPPLTDLNPNGRLPVIEDPNRPLVLWESSAIITYLVQEYDKNHSLTYAEGDEVHHINQWLHFQTSGQGPYYGQAAWFKLLHHERLQSATDRYVNEVRRVLGVLDRSLEGKEWLVGDKMTFVDLAWVPWNELAPILLDSMREEMLGQYPNVKAWHERLISRASWKKVLELKDLPELNL